MNSEWELLNCCLWRTWTSAGVANVFYSPSFIFPSLAGVNQQHYIESHRSQDYAAVKLASAQSREGRCSILSPFCFHLSHKPGGGIDWVNSFWTCSSKTEFPLPHTSLHPVPHLPRYLLSSCMKRCFAACWLEFVLLLKSCLPFLLYVNWGRKHFIFNQRKLHSEI